MCGGEETRDDESTDQQHNMFPKLTSERNMDNTLTHWLECDTQGIQTMKTSIFSLVRQPFFIFVFSNNQLHRGSDLYGNTSSNTCTGRMEYPLGQRNVSRPVFDYIPIKDDVSLPLYSLVLPFHIPLRELVPSIVSMLPCFTLVGDTPLNR